MSKAPPADNLPLPPLPDIRYPCVSIDLPWHYTTRAPVQNPEVCRTPQRHYPTMDLEAIEKIPMRDICAPDSNIFFWITGPLLAKGIHNRLARAWGARTSSLWLVWIKLWNSFDSDQLFRTPLLDNDIAMGTGFTTRQNAEFVMLMRMGNGMPRRRHDIRQVLISNRREHSRKPEEFYRRVEHYSDGPRLDMFAGADRPGWDRYGWGHRDGEGERYEAEG